MRNAEWGRSNRECRGLSPDIQGAISKTSPPLTDSLDQAIVLLMSSDPKPDRHIPTTASKRPVALSDPNRPDISEQGLELQRWVKGIPPPEAKLVSSKRLDFHWKFLKTIPETSLRFRDHGMSVSRPLSMSSSTSRNT